MRAILISVLFVSLLAAAPAPPAAPPPEFGASGLLTLDDLKAVTFQSRVLRAEQDLKKLELKRGERPEDYDVAVHLPRTRIKQGEPIPAYFAVKNKSNIKIGLRMLLDFSGSVQLRGEATFGLRCLTPAPVKILVQRSTHCSEDSLVDIPANGFYVARGDLNRLAEEPLPPGEYEVEWSCRLRASASVKFTVLASDVPAKQAKFKDASHSFVAIESDDPEAGDDDRFLWNDYGMERIDSDRMSAALAVGQFGKYVPDLRTIPATDGRVEVRASLRREGDIEKLIVTLLSKDPRNAIAFEDVPHVYLQIEEKGTGKEQDRGKRSLRDQMKRAEPRFETPLTIEIPFDAERRKEADFANGRRLAVIVTSGKLEFPTRGKRMAELQLESLRRPPADPEKVWTGIVRSEFIPLNANK